MATNLVSSGSALSVDCPYATVASGAGVLVGSIFGVALGDSVTGSSVEICRDGEWTLTAKSTDEFAVGDLIYWDDSNKECTITSTGNTLVGIATAVKANPAATGQVLLNVITSAASPDVVTSTVVTVTTGQLLALYTTPKAFVAAPGAGKAIVPVSAQLFLDYATTGYDGIAAGEDLVFRYTDASGGIAATVEATGFLDATADAHREAQFATLITPTADAALVLHMSSGNIATGDSPLKVKLRYRVVTLLT